MLDSVRQLNDIQEGGIRTNMAKANFVLDQYQRLAERVDFEAIFAPATDPVIDVEMRALSIRREVLNAVEPELLTELIPDLSASTAKHWPNKVAGRRNSHLWQAASLAYHSGLLYHEGDVHVNDLCGGTGLVSSVSHYLRRQLGKTTSTCIELRGELRAKHDFIKARFGSTGHHFLERDLYDFDFSRGGDSAEYCLAKHACGPLTDHIIGSVVNLEPGAGPDHTVVLTCCHGHISAQKFFPPRLEGVIKPEDWYRLAGLAQMCGNPDPIQKETGKVAMALVNCLRCLNLPDRFNPIVKPIIPESVTPQNQAIFLFDMEAEN